jgi:pyruvate dehydrogenase E2 component (dihydrolipoamide acetyltransferase)
MVVEGGLVAPLIREADKKNLVETARYSGELIRKARAGKLNVDDLEGGCITVSNLGSLGVESFIPIVVPGQCSILGIGKITDTCVPSNGEIVSRRLMDMTLSVDHRIVNGAYAARFLDHIKKLLEDPESL